MSQRRSRASGSRASAAASIEAAAAAAAAHSVPAAEAQPMDGDGEMVDAAPAAAAASDHPMLQLLSGLSFESFGVACQKLKSQISDQLRLMSQNRHAIVDAAEEHLKRVGVEGEKSAAAKALLAQLREAMKDSITKEHELSVLQQVVESLARDAIAGKLPIREDMSLTFNQLVPEREIYLCDQNPDSMHQLQRSITSHIDEFNQKCWNVHHDGAYEGEYEEGGDDSSEVMIAAANTEAELTCPLTRQLLDEPVRSRRCGHLYSTEAIHDYLLTAQRNKDGSEHRAASSELRQDFEAKCPVVGCRSKINMGSLVADKDVARRVKELQQSREGEEGSGRIRKRSAKVKAEVDCTQSEAAEE